MIDYFTGYRILSSKIFSLKLEGITPVLCSNIRPISIYASKEQSIKGNDSFVFNFCTLKPNLTENWSIVELSSSRREQAEQEEHRFSNQAPRIPLNTPGPLSLHPLQLEKQKKKTKNWHWYSRPRGTGRGATSFPGSQPCHPFSTCLFCGHAAGSQRLSHRMGSAGHGA